MTEFETLEFEKCKQDIVYFAENYIKIITIENGLQLIKLKPYQVRVLQELQANGKFALSAPRQTGRSTLLAIKLLHYIVFNNNKLAIVLNKKFDNNQIIIERFLTSYFGLPKFLQSEVSYYCNEYIEFTNKSKIIFKLISEFDNFKNNCERINCDIDTPLIFVENYDYCNPSVDILQQLQDYNVVINTNLQLENFKLVKITSSEAYPQNFKDCCIKNFGLDYWIREYEVL